MVWEKICIVIALLILYLSPLSTLSIKVVADKSINDRHIIGQSIVILSFLIVVLLWMKEFNIGNIVFLKKYSIIVKLLATILLFYATSFMITSSLK